MNYKNPIRILTPDQIKRLDTTTLKSIKKEILLHFQLSDSPTIERNGFEVDKNEVLEIFEELQKDLPLHLEIYKNDKLKKLLETEDLSFFFDPNAQNAVLENQDFCYKINGFIASRMNPVTAKLLEQIDSSSRSRLAAIFEYTSKMPPEQQDKAYNKAYVTLKAMVDDLPVEHPDPFVSSRSNHFHNAIPRLVDLNFYNCFSYLPGAFKDISFMYAVWCHNNIVNGAFRRETIFENFKRHDLFTLLEACDIAVNITTSDNFRQNGRDLRKYLKEPVPKKDYSYRHKKYSKSTRRKDSSDDGYGLNVLRIIALIVIFLRILSGMADCNNNNQRANRYNYNPPSHSSYPMPDMIPQTDEELIEKTLEQMEGVKGVDKEKLRKMLNEQLGKNRKQNRGNLEEQLVGDKSEGWEKTLTNMEMQDSLVLLNYDVRVMPTKKDELADFIPEEVYIKYPGQYVEFLLEVKDIDNEEQVFKHRFKYSLKRNGRRRTVIYDGRKNKNGNKDHLVVDRMRKNGKLIKGSITRFDTKDLKPTESTNFQIDYDKQRELQPREEGPDGAISDGRFEKYNGFKITEGVGEAYKNMILHNLNKIHYKDLKLGNYYTLDPIYVCPVNFIDKFVVSGDKIKTEKPLETKGSLTYYSCSNEDNIALCSLNGKGFTIRYFVDRKTKKVIRMQMAVSGPNGRVAELIKVILE